MDDGAWVRGTIDCLIRTAKQVMIVEFKTGRRRDAHQRQLDLYREAAARLFPGLTVEARLVYAGEPAPGRRSSFA
jgi:ATP-dependent exoDNAse (exonuclease V) beta subunit